MDERTPVAASTSAAATTLVTLPTAPSADDADAGVDSSTITSIVAQPLYGVRAPQLDIGSYIHNKRIKVRHQFQQQTQAASPMNLSPLTSTLPPPSSSPHSPLLPPPSSSPSSLFSGLVFWVNGLTSPPAHHLLPLVYLHGGSVENVLVALVTHCVADRVPTTKVREWKEKSRRKRWIVQAKWVVDCVREGKRLPEHDYLVEELRERGVVSVKGMLLPANRQATPAGGQSEQVTEDSEHQEERVSTPTAGAPSSATVATHPPAVVGQLPASGSPLRVSNADPVTAVSTAPPLPVHEVNSAAASSPPVGAPLSFRSLSSRSSPSLPPPPAPPLPNYLQQLLPPAPYDFSQELSKRASRVLTHPPMSPPSALPPPPPLPPVTHPYVPPPPRQPLTLAPSTSSASPSAALTTNPAPAASAVPAALAPSTSSASPAPPAPPAPPTCPLPLLQAALLPGAPSSATVSASSSSSSVPQSVLLPAHMTGASGTLAGGRLSGRSTLNDPHFVKTFFAASRLHFIGSWKRLFQGLIPSLLAIPPRVPAASYTTPSPSSPTYILHCDLDCFFASISQRDNPALKDKPVAVCHARAADPDPSPDAAFNPFTVSSTSSISSCNYLARSFGLHAEMSIGRARRMCPDLVVVPYEFEKYAQASEAIYRTFFSVTHRIQAVSLDECYMELPAGWKESEVEEVVKDVRRRVEATTGVQVSIGVGHSLLLARLATKAAKPNNFHFLTASSPLTLQTYMAGLPVSEIPGIGWAGQHRLLTDLKVSTCGQLQAVSRDRLQSMFGPKAGLTIYDSCRGIDHRPLVPVGHADGRSSTSQQSIAVNINYGVRFEREEHVRTFLYDLSAELLDRLASTHLTAHLLSIKLMVRHPAAPIEPPKKFLGHGVCDTRNKSRSIEGRGIGEGVGHEGEKERLAGIVLELWDKLRAEFKIKMEDLRGVGLQFNRLKPRVGSAGKSPSPFSAWKVLVPAGSVEEKAERVEGMEVRGAEESMMEEEMEMEDGENEWKEDGMEEDMEDVDDSPTESAHKGSSAPPAPPAPPQEVSPRASRNSPSMFPELAVGHTSDARPPPSTPTAPAVSSSVQPPSAASLLSPAMTLPAPASTPSAFPSAGALGTATVQLSMDQLMHVINAYNQQLQQSSARSSELIQPPPLISPAAPPVISPAQAPPSATSTSHTVPPAAPQSSPAPPTPSLDDVVAQVQADKERAFLHSLPAFAALDRAVISALPIDIRQELASAYKKKRGMEKEKEEASTLSRQSATTAFASDPQPSAAASRSTVARSARPVGSSASPVTFEQLDPTTLAELPADIREEVERQFRRGRRSAAAPTHPRSANAAAASKGTRGGRRTVKKKPVERVAATVPPPSHARSGLPGVSIVSHFTVADHERRVERERGSKSSRPSDEAEAQVIVLDEAPSRVFSRMPSTSALMEPDDIAPSQQLAMDADEKYGGGETPQRSTSPYQRRKSAREEKEAEHQRREALQERAEKAHRRTVDERTNPASRPRTVPSSLSSSATSASSASDGELLMEALRGAESTFLSSASVLPHFSRWLHALQRAAPHRHPAPLSLHACCLHVEGETCSCSPHCFCPMSSPHQSLSCLLLAQLRLRNVECVAALVKAMRQALSEREEEQPHSTPPPAPSTHPCVCFQCSVKQLVERVEGQVVGEYGAALKPKPRSSVASAGAAAVSSVWAAPLSA